MASQPQNSNAYKSRDLNIGTLDSSIRMHQNFLKRHLIRPIRKWFKSTYDESVKWSKDQNLSGRHVDLRVFQESLREVPKWNAEQISEECKWICDQTSSKFRFQKTLKILFISKSMLLAAIRPMANENEELEIDVPSTDTYLHKVLCLCSECFFQYPSLFRNDLRDTEDRMEKNNRLIKDTIDECLLDAITDLLPCAEIVDKYLDEEIKAKEFQPVPEQKVTVAVEEDVKKNEKVENPDDVKEISKVNEDDDDYGFDDEDEESEESENSMAENDHSDEEDDNVRKKAVESKMAAKRASFAAKKAKKEAVKAKQASDEATNKVDSFN